MWDFLFKDSRSGEIFFVECDTLEEAKEIIVKYFPAFAYHGVKYLGKYSQDEAEILGYDTY